MKKTDKTEKKDKRSLLIIIIVIALIILIGCIFFFAGHKKTSPPKETFYDYPEDMIKTVKICKAKECGYPDNKFHFIALKKEYSGLQDTIKEINNETEKYYNEVKNSDFTADECSEAKEKYNYSKYIDRSFDNYESDKYISLAVTNTFVDLCTNKNQSSATKVYIYDKKTNAMTTQEEFKKAYNITDEMALNAIKDQKESLEKAEITKFPENAQYDNFNYFYSVEGNILVSYHVQGTDIYYVAPLMIVK